MDKLKSNLIIVISVLLLLVFMQTCKNTRILRKIDKDLTEVKSTVNTTNQRVVPYDLFESMLKIEGINISYRMLYDNNTVIRTTKRPDDIMHSYISKRDAEFAKRDTLIKKYSLDEK